MIISALCLSFCSEFPTHAHNLVYFLFFVILFRYPLFNRFAIFMRSFVSNRMLVSDIGIKTWKREFFFCHLPSPKQINFSLSRIFAQTSQLQKVLGHILCPTMDIPFVFNMGIQTVCINNRTKKKTNTESNHFYWASFILLTSKSKQIASANDMLLEFHKRIFSARMNSEGVMNACRDRQFKQTIFLSFCPVVFPVEKNATLF